MMQANFGRDSVILPMPCPGPSEDDYGGREILYNGSPRVLWIGRICEVKRPDRLLDLAETCPDLNFDLVGPQCLRAGKDYHQRYATRPGFARECSGVL